MKKVFAAALASVLVLAPAAAHAFCGFYVGGADAKLFNDATVVVLMRDGTRTVLSMQNNYQGPPSSFAMVVPVPVILQKENVKTLPRAVFDKVDQLTAPRLVEYWEQDPCMHHYPRPPVKYSAVPDMRPMSAPTGSPGLGVKIEAQFTVGEYEIVILSANDSTGLETWLTQNKYAIPPNSEPLLKPYVQMGMKFFVAKVDPTKVKMDGNKTMLSPLRFHYDADSFHLPIRLGMVNSSGTQDLIVNVLARGQRYEVANYENVAIPTNMDVADASKQQFGAFYAALFDKTIEKHPKAVVTEYAWDASTCDPCPGPALDGGDFATLGADVLPDASENGPPRPSVMPGRRPMFVGSGGFTVTRLHMRYAKGTLGDDLFFKTAGPIEGGRETRDSANKLEQGAKQGSINNFQARYAIRHPWTGAIKCKDPQRGLWGGPPGQQHDPWSPAPPAPPAPASKVQFAPRGGVQLAALVKGAIPTEDVLSSAGATPTFTLGSPGVTADAGSETDAAPEPTPAPDAAPAPATTTAPAPKQGGCAGCSTTGATAPSGLLAGALVAIAALMRRRTRDGSGSKK